MKVRTWEDVCEENEDALHAIGADVDALNELPLNEAFSALAEKMGISRQEFRKNIAVALQDPGFCASVPAEVRAELLKLSRDG